MINNIYLFHYNNYFNRQVKKLSTIDDYISADSDYLKISGVNFNPADGVFTKHVIGTYSVNQDYDYLIVVDEVVENDVTTETINSRWFIIEDDRTRDGQYEIVLKRDVIVDNYDAVVDAPMYIEKGFINDVNNPLLYNSEGLAVNQIKQSEIALKDETKSGWVVGYVPSDAFSTSSTISKNIAISLNPNISVNGLSNWEYWSYCTNNSNYKFISDATGERTLTFKIKDYYMTVNGRTVTYYPATRLISMKVNSSDTASLTTVDSGSFSVTSSAPVFPNWYTNYTNVAAFQGPLSAKDVNKILEPLKGSSTFKIMVNAVLGTDIAIGNVNAIINLDGQIIKDTSSNQYWRIRIISSSPSNPLVISTSTTAGNNLISYINDNINRHPAVLTSVTGNYTTGDITAIISEPAYAIQLENVGVGVEVTLDSDRSHLNDAPYDMFCIPYSDTLQLYDGTNTITCNKSIAVGIATEIGRDSGSGNLYDIQLLPYCPNRALIYGSTNPQILDLRNVKYDIITDSVLNTPVGAVIWCTDSTFKVEVRQDPDELTFTEPFEDVYTPTVKNSTYYSIPDLNNESITQVQRCAIGTGSTNAIKVLICRRSDGKVMDTYYLSTLEITNYGSYIRGYSYGHSANPELEFTASDYNFNDNFFTFIVEGSVGIGAQYIENFLSVCKYPSIPTLTAPNDPLERKLDNECNLYRLVSNNYNGIFEFSVAKSGGIGGFIAECTYKPWAPYIHILPKLKGLYGDKFVEIDDARGLICGGDYSLPQLSNEWSNYQLQNKTYQDMFDRQIKNIDITNDIAKTQAGVQAGLGAIQGMVSGAVAGGYSGNPYGAIAGAVIGGVASATAGAVDYSLLLKQQEENRSYTIDMYNYNLQNIQAIPTSLTKTSALVYNTRIFPFIEYYTCTPTERQALEDKIKYNGMSVLAIGKLRDFIVNNEEHFYKGKLIRLTDMTGDSHIANAIYDELYKGVYM